MDESSERFDPREHLPTKAFAERALAYVGTALIPIASRTPEQQAFVVGYEMERAVEVAGTLADYCRPTLPERPLSFPEDDQVLKRALGDARRALRPSMDERTLLSEYGAWRHACAYDLVEAESRIVSLIGAARTFETYGRGEAVAVAMRQQVVDYLLSEWGVTLGPVTPTYWQAKVVGRDAGKGLIAAADPATDDGQPRGGREEWRDDERRYDD